MTAELKATLKKHDNGSWSITLSGDGAESSNALWAMHMESTRDHPQVLILAEASGIFSQNEISITFNVSEGPDIALTEEYKRQLKYWQPDK
jgi:hypothetical protein